MSTLPEIYLFAYTLWTFL